MLPSSSSRSDSVSDAEDISNQPGQEIVHENQNGEPDGTQNEESDAADDRRLAEFLLRGFSSHANDSSPRATGNLAELRLNLILLLLDLVL